MDLVKFLYGTSGNCCQLYALIYCRRPNPGQANNREERSFTHLLAYTGPRLHHIALDAPRVGFRGCIKGVIGAAARKEIDTAGKVSCRVVADEAAMSARFTMQVTKLSGDLDFHLIGY